MADQFVFRIAAGKEGADDIGLLDDGSPNGHGKDKGHNGDDDIQQHNDHGPVAAHVIPCKADRLVEIPGNEALKRGLLVYCRHHILGHILFLLLIFRRCIIEPAVAVEEPVLRKLGKALLRYNSHAELKGIKHGVVVVLKQSAVVRQGDEAGNCPVLALGGKDIPHRQAVVIGVHPVDGDLVPPDWEAAGHEAGGIHLLPGLEDAQCCPIVKGFFNVKVIVKADAHLADIFLLGLIQLLFHPEVAVLHVVFFKALIVGDEHAAVRHQKTGNQGNGHGKKQKNHDILPCLAPEFPEYPLAKRILYHSSSSASRGVSLR